ncbi:hypothetical protein ACIA8O_34070 [Kitasatospora sp. NPDC051853]|uniref:hypothetical protein n=1 Tax=Kitasatospora sp. NPDC051853 TaxID=3364058 RepID=UPI00379E0C67
MTQKVRFLTIVALGFSILTGTAALQLADSTPAAATVMTADGAPGDTADNVTTGEPAPASSAVPSPIPTGTQGTWGWG